MCPAKILMMTTALIQTCSKRPSRKQTPAKHETPVSSPDLAVEILQDVDGSSGGPSSRRVFYKRSKDFVRRIRQQGDGDAARFIRPTRSPSQTRVKTPREYMEVFIPPRLYRDIALRSNQTAVTSTGKSLLLKDDECVQFFGACLLMSVLKFPWVRMYWSQPTRIAAIADAFTRDRFHLIRGGLKVVNDNDVTEEDKKDRLWKVRPFIEPVRSG